MQEDNSDWSKPLSSATGSTHSDYGSYKLPKFDVNGGKTTPNSLLQFINAE